MVGLFLVLWSPPAARADRVPADCNGSGLGITLFTSSPDVHIGDTLHYSINVFNGTPNSGRIVCDATEIQAWIVTPDGKSNTVTLLRRTLHQAESDFYPDVVSYVVRAQDIQPDGTLRARAYDTGVIHQNDTNSQGGGEQGVNTEVNMPCIKLTVECVASVGEMGAIIFNGTVTNCGNNTLVGVTVTNYDNSGQFSVQFLTNLAIGQKATFTGTWIPFNACNPSTVTLIARASDEFTSTPRLVTNSATATCQNVLTPGIKVTKVCPTAPVSPGQLLTFSGSVSNTGNITLTNIVVVNNQPVANTPVYTLASLAPGAVANFTGSYLAPTNCSVTDTLTASAFSVCGVPVSNTASATCSIVTNPKIAVTTVCSTNSIIPNGLVTYAGTVRNTGDITLTNVVVSSDRPAANTKIFTKVTLAPGEIANYTASFTVAANECTVPIVVAATGNDICTGVAAVDSTSTACSVTTSANIAVTLVCPPVTAHVGGPITYSGTARNSGNVILNNVFVVIDQPAANTAVLGPITLAPGATTNFSTTFTAPADVCSVSATVTATGRDACSAALVSQTASATCSLATTPAITVTQTCPVVPAVPGGLLTYTGTVNNSGDVTITNVVVLNNMSGATPIFTAASLAPGTTVSFSGSYLATTNCVSVSTSTATGRSICGAAVSNFATASCSIMTSPLIAVTAACPPTSIVPGGVVTYTGTVRNNGNIALTNVVIVSDRPSAGTTVFTKPSLAPGESANYSASFTMPAGDCNITTSITVTGNDFCSGIAATGATAITCSIVTAPGVVVALTCPTGTSTVGSPITYSGTVRNSGNVTLTNVYVVNNQPVPNSPVVGPFTLAPGAIQNFTSTFNAPLDSCSASSTVTATGGDNCTGLLVSNSVTATCPLITAPAIFVNQNCPANPVIPGTVLTYIGSVKNTGNITLTNVVVLNNMSGTTPIFTASLLSPGMEVAFTGSYVTPTNCYTTSTSTATGRSICDIPVTNSVSTTCAILTAPAIKVTQKCPDNSVLQGGILTYSGSVSNAGNITLTNVIVVNNWPNPNVVVFTVASLAPGDVKTFTGSFVVPVNCCVAWSTVVATGQDCTATIVSDTDSGTCQVLTLPRIVVTKICPTDLLRPGDVLNYSGTVSNAGNVSLIHVSVVDSQSGTGSLLSSLVTLAPGESIPYYASYIVPPDFCGTDTVTATGLDDCSYAVIANSVTTTCPILMGPRIYVTQTCPPQHTAHGSLLVYSGTVGNSGNVTLTNVYVVSNQPSNNAPVIGPITLAPGDVIAFTGSFLAPQFCCQITDTLSARGRDRCYGSNVTATATAICPLLYTPALTVTPNCPATPVAMGSLFTFSGLVINTGDAILTNVLVFNSQAGQKLALLGPIDLAPGESKHYSGSIIVASNICSVDVMATGQETCAGNTVNNTGSCPVATIPLLAVTQNCPASLVGAGGLLTYSGSVSNGGNITLNNIVVSNDRSGITPIFTVAALLPGESMPFTGSYIAPTNATTTSTSTATATSLCGSMVLKTASSTCVTPQQPSIGGNGVPAITSKNGTTTFSFKSESGVSYLVQYKSKLNDPSWTTLQTKAGNGGVLTITDTSTSSAMRFYRVILAP